MPGRYHNPMGGCVILLREWIVTLMIHPPTLSHQQCPPCLIAASRLSYTWPSLWWRQQWRHVGRFSPIKLQRCADGFATYISDGPMYSVIVIWFIVSIYLTLWQRINFFDPQIRFRSSMTSPLKVRHISPTTVALCKCANMLLTYVIFHVCWL